MNTLFPAINCMEIIYHIRFYGITIKEYMRGFKHGSCPFRLPVVVETFFIVPTHVHSGPSLLNSATAGKPKAWSLTFSVSFSLTSNAQVTNIQAAGRWNNGTCNILEVLSSAMSTTCLLAQRESTKLTVGVLSDRGSRIQGLRGKTLIKGGIYCLLPPPLSSI